MFEPMQHRIKSARAHSVAVSSQFLDHPVPIELALYRVMQNVQPDQPCGDFLMFVYIRSQANSLYRFP